MPINTIGDQARAFALQAASHRLKTTLATLTQEMASGESADIAARFQGHTRVLGDIETRISAITQFQKNISDANIFATGTQSALEGVRSEIQDLGFSLASDPFPDGSTSIGIRIAQTAGSFEVVVQRLNAKVSGRFVMSGLASDRPPLASAGLILDDLAAITAGMTTAAQVSQAISDWFDAPPGGGGFLDNAYAGTIGQPHQFRLAEDLTIPLQTSAASPAIRSTLKGLAMVAILDRGVLAGQDAERRQLIRSSGSELMTADRELIAEMGRVGLSQQMAEQAGMSNASALGVLQLSRGELRSADPYETATALAEVTSQMESLYTIMSRLSKLKLVDYLR